MKPFANRVKSIANVGAFGIWTKAMALEAQGREIVHLEVGEPDFDTPAHIVAAANASFARGRTHYDTAVGTPALRQAIAEAIQQQRGFVVDADCVVATPGVKGGLFYTMQILLSRGGEVLVPDPGYPPYQQVVQLAEGVPVPYTLTAENGYQIDSAEIRAKITPATTAIIINSPSNPTGTILNQQSLNTIADIASEHDLWVLSDEIYSRINFADDSPPSLLQFDRLRDRTIIYDGFSKAYAMTGWRLGYAIVPPALVQLFADLMINAHSCLPTFIMDAGVAALEGSQDCVTEMVAIYRNRCDLAVSILETIPNIHFTRPTGAFYIMIDVRGVTDDVTALADRLLEAGVALLPGDSFGKHGEGFLRLAFCQSEAQIRRGLELFRDEIIR